MVEHECPRCHREVELPFGQLCRDCARELDRKAGRIARRVALLSTAAVAAYTFLRVPREQTASMIAAAGVVAWYLLSYLTARRIAREFVT